MRHNVDGRKLGRTSAHRKALYKNLVISLIQHERIRRGGLLDSFQVTQGSRVVPALRT